MTLSKKTGGRAKNAAFEQGSGHANGRGIVGHHARRDPDQRLRGHHIPMPDPRGRRAGEPMSGGWRSSVTARRASFSRPTAR